MSGHGKEIPADAETRIANLEIRLSHQDRTVEELNETIIRQWHEIDVLKRKLGLLQERMESVERDSSKPAGQEPPPPHY
jgi:SlyX protein